LTRKNPDSATRLAAVIGDPVAQSLSPIIHNAVFESLKVNWLYLAFLVEAGKVKDALDAMAVFGIAGFSVTMPHKNEVARLVREIGEIDEIVRVTNSANTVMLRQDGSIFATNTDGQGACNAIEANSSQKIAKSQVVVLGAGGTASAVVYSLIKNGAAEVVIANRTPANAEKIAQNYENCRVSSNLDQEMAKAEIIINTTPVGFNPSGEQNSKSVIAPIDVTLINATHTVLDAVYRPLETGLLGASKKVGAQTIDGLEMLVHQASLQQEVWLGTRGDTDLMRRAALDRQ
jgi:shikimate dehydrogenase